jgi:hypothetical protein
MPCAVAGCNKRAVAKFEGGDPLCQAHYNRHWREHHYLVEIWRNMAQRCYNQKSARHRYYGARGITVCERWRSSFEVFAADVGPRPSPKHTLGRIDNEGDYRPGNVEWQTRTEQNRNQRSNCHITAYGRTQILADWARETGISATSIRYRLKVGWSPEAAITIPRGPAGRKRRAA